MTPITPLIISVGYLSCSNGLISATLPPFTSALMAPQCEPVVFQDPSADTAASAARINRPGPSMAPADTEASPCINCLRVIAMVCLKSQCAFSAKSEECSCRYFSTSAWVSAFMLVKPTMPENIAGQVLASKCAGAGSPWQTLQPSEYVWSA